MTAVTTGLRCDSDVHISVTVNVRITVTVVATDVTALLQYSGTPV